MDARLLKACIASIALLGPGMAAIAQEKPAPTPTPVQVEDVPAERAKRFRGWVIKLRAEVEGLQLDYDIARTDLVDDLKMMKSLDVATGLMAILGAMDRATIEAPAQLPHYARSVDAGEIPVAPSVALPNSLPPPPISPNTTEPPVVLPAPRGSNRLDQAPVDKMAKEKAAKELAAEAEKSEQKRTREMAKYLADKKKELARLAKSLAEKRLDLEDAEARYRKTDIEDRPFPHVEAPAPVPAAHPVEAKPVASGRTECITNEDRDRVPIVDPVIGGKVTDCCLAPPTEAEVWKKIPNRTNQGPSSRLNNIEKIGEKVDARKEYPLAGPCQLIHCHYKATVNILDGGTPRVEVIYFDKNHLRRCPDPGQALPVTAEPKSSALSGDPRPFWTIAPAELATMQPFPVAPIAVSEARMAAIEAKLDKILKAIDSK